jgi:membrane protease YdiL (CAAX protease family)
MHEPSVEPQLTSRPESSRPVAPGPSPRDRLRAFLEIVMVSLGASILAESLFLLAGGGGEIAEFDSPGLAALVLLQNLIALGMIGLFLQVDGHRFRYLGYRVHGAAIEILLGLVLCPAILILAGIFRLGLQRFLPALPTLEENPLLGLISEPRDVAFFLVLSVLAGGLGEETVRAFVLRRFESSLGGIWFGLVAWSALFGAMHWTQGPDVAVTVGFVGFLLGLIYLWRRNPLAPLVAHAAFDVVQTLAAYSQNSA